MSKGDNYKFPLSPEERLKGVAWEAMKAALEAALSGVLVDQQEFESRLVKRMELLETEVEHLVGGVTQLEKKVEQLEKGTPDGFTDDG